LLQHFNICSFPLWMPIFLWIPGAVVPFASPLYTPQGVPELVWRHVGNSPRVLAKALLFDRPRYDNFHKHPPNENFIEIYCESLVHLRYLLSFSEIYFESFMLSFKEKQSIRVSCFGSFMRKYLVFTETLQTCCMAFLVFKGFPFRCHWMFCFTIITMLLRLWAKSYINKQPDHVVTSFWKGLIG